MAYNEENGPETGKETSEKPVIKRIEVKPSDIQKMQMLRGLFIDDLPLDAKENELIAFFFRISFDQFLKSDILQNKFDEARRAG